jgi:hypothetical protein
MLNIIIHFDASCRTIRATMIHGRASTKAAISREVCGSPKNNDNIIIIIEILQKNTTTQLFETLETTIQSSNTISRKTHSVASRTTQVIFNHKGRTLRLNRLLNLQGNSFLRATAAITVRKIDNNHISMLVTRRAIFPPFSSTIVN